MSEPSPIYLNDTRGDYWQKVAEKERQKSEDNLRLAAERASEIAELRQELKAAQAEIEHLKAENKDLCKFISDNTFGIGYSYEEH